MSNGSDDSALIPTVTGDVHKGSFGLNQTVTATVNCILSLGVNFTASSGHIIFYVYSKTGTLLYASQLNAGTAYSNTYNTAILLLKGMYVTINEMSSCLNSLCYYNNIY